MSRDEAFVVGVVATALRERKVGLGTEQHVLAELRSALATQQPATLPPESGLRVALDTDVTAWMADSDVQYWVKAHHSGSWAFSLMERLRSALATQQPATPDGPPRTSARVLQQPDPAYIAGMKEHLSILVGSLTDEHLREHADAALALTQQPATPEYGWMPGDGPPDDHPSQQPATPDRTWTGPGEKPHRYSPDLMAGGDDCRICGHVWDAHQQPATLPPSETCDHGLLAHRLFGCAPSGLRDRIEALPHYKSSRWAVSRAAVLALIDATPEHNHTLNGETWAVCGACGTLPLDPNAKPRKGPKADLWGNPNRAERMRTGAAHGDWFIGSGTCKTCREPYPCKASEEPLTGGTNGA